MFSVYNQAIWPLQLVAYALATVLVALRWPVVLGVIAVAVFAAITLPALGTSGGGLSDITSSKDPAIVAETPE